MNPLPPLRTIRDGGSDPRDPAPVTPSVPPPRLIPGLDHPAVPPPARGLVAEVVTAGLLSAEVVPDFLAEVGNRLPSLTSRERTGEALCGLGFLTRYQLSRVLAGQTFGLALGGYRVLDRLCSGSVGVVFLGEHPVLKRRVAIKVVAEDDGTDPGLIDRFRSEVRLIAGLSHPHVVTVYDAGVVPSPGAGQPGLCYLVLEVVPGGDMEQYVCDRGPQPVGLACEWGRQTATALRTAHAAGIVHRDLKPSNLLLTAERRVKVIDFGLAREFDSTRTAPRTLLGSLEFMAPEQLADAPTAGPPADVYGLGATLFWVLTGDLPYPAARTPSELIAAIRSHAPRRAREVQKTVPAAVDTLLARMLARNPADRPTAAEAAAELAKFSVPTTHPSQDDVPIITDDDTEAEQLRFGVRQLEDLVTAARDEAAESRRAVTTALAAAAAARPGESPGHQKRVGGYVRALAAALLGHPDWPMLADGRFVDDLVRAAEAHDVGLVGVPDAVLAAPEPRTSADRLLFEAHTTIGSSLLDRLADDHGPALPGLRVLRAVVRSHHERWDGTGYPDRLAGLKIPPAARLVGVADAYDALRDLLPHADALRQLSRQSGAGFDPVVVEALVRCGDEIARIYDTIPDRLGAWS